MSESELLRLRFDYQTALQMLSSDLTDKALRRRYAETIEVYNQIQQDEIAALRAKNAQLEVQRAAALRLSRDVMETEC